MTKPDRTTGRPSGPRSVGGNDDTIPAFAEIPVLSLRDWSEPGGDRPGFADRLRTICHEIGFLQIVDHGVDETFLDRYFAALQAFFDLPEAAKARIDKANSPWFRGWERLGTELTDNHVDHREQLDVWTEHAPVDVGTVPERRLLGPNQWPDESLLPGFRALVERFQREMGALADQLLAAMCVGLGLDAGSLERRFGDRRMSLVKLIHYPATPPASAGVNAHHDTGFLTLLWQHGVPGLQVQNQAGDWIDIPAREGAVVVNLGEMLQSMTGNYFVATTHRVVTGSERFSSAYFHGPSLDMPLTPLPLPATMLDAVAHSPHHVGAGFMARRDELLAGRRGTTSAAAPTYGEQLWNYFSRSYPDLVARPGFLPDHPPDEPPA